MNLKKILIVSLVILAIFSSMSVASAGFLEDLFGPAEEPEPFNTTVENVTFTIPGGYEEQSNLTITNSIAESDGQNSNQKAFYDELNDDAIVIAVHKYDDGEIYYDGNGTSKTIAGKEGYYTGNETGFYTFSFIENNKGIDIIATNESVISDIVASIK